MWSGRVKPREKIQAIPENVCEIMDAFFSEQVTQTIWKVELHEGAPAVAAS